MNATRRVTTGIAAAVGIAALAVGVPILLLTLGFNPARAHINTLNDLWIRLSMPDDGSLVAAVLTIAAWIAWAYLTAALIIETAASIRRRPTPRVPGLRLGLKIAKALVGGVLLFTVTAPLINTPNPAHATPAPQHTVSAPAQTTPDTSRTAQVSVPGIAKYTTVTVREHDTLSGLAARHLGDAGRWPEIFKASTGIRQPGGVYLRNPNKIDIGWTLHIPTAHANTTHPNKYTTVTVREHDTLSGLAARHLGDAGMWPEIFEASKGIRQPGGVYLTDADAIDIGWTLHIPTAHATKTEVLPAPTAPATPPVPPPAAPATQVAQEQADTPAQSAQPGPVQTLMQAGVDDDRAPNWTVAAGVGAMLAAGVIATVSWRRRLQARRLRPGLRIPMPEGETASLEQHLRSAQDPISLDQADRALRALARDLAAQNQPLPDLRAARLSDGGFELYLASPANLPPPWQGTTDATVWCLDPNPPDPGNLTDQPAPYPSLVTIGQDEEGGIVLIDLEYAGALAITGTPDTAKAAIAAILIELALSAMADDLTLTAVGGFAELEDAITAGRIRYLPTVERLLDDLDARAAGDRQTLDEAAAETVHDARSRRVAPDTWTPEIAIIAGDMTSRQRTLLAHLVAKTPNLAIATVTGPGIEPIGEWRLTIETPTRAMLEPVGLVLAPQLVAEEQYEQITGIFQTASADLIETQIPTADALLDLPASQNQHAADPIWTGGWQPLDNAASTPTGFATSPIATETLPQATNTPDTGQPTPQAPQAPQTATHACQEPSLPGSIPAGAAELDSEVVPLPIRPYIRVLGPVELANATGPVEETKRPRLLEHACYLLFHPGATPGEIDEAIWPARAREDNTTTRNTSTAKLRRWLGTTDTGDYYLPRYSSTLTGVGSDWNDWKTLLPNGPLMASTTALEKALRLVGGRPFADASPRRYGWAEPLRTEMRSQIVDAASILAARRLADNDWHGVEQACATALAIEPLLENLWRHYLVALHFANNIPARDEAESRLRNCMAGNELDLDPETERLLEDLHTGHVGPTATDTLNQLDLQEAAI